MKFQLVLLVGALAVAMVAMLANGEEETGLANKLVKHKLFDFARFKSMFGKKYSSMAEEISRSKIFFANAFRAFLSLIGYKNKTSGMYLKINDKSDWTNEELRSLEGKFSNEQMGISKQAPVPQDGTDLNEIVGELNKVVENKNSHPFFAKITDGLKSLAGIKRSKRDTGDKRDSLTLDDLFEEPMISAEASNLGELVPSNNDMYQPPELTSFGTEDTSKPQSNSWSSYAISGFNSIGSLISSVGQTLFSDDQDINAHPKTSSLPDVVYVDHSKGNCFTKIKNQGQCGSCFIFSTTALFEWHYCKQFGMLVTFSEQYAIDCGARIGLTGCSGGQELSVSKFYSEYGIELQKNYPYRMHVDTCPYDSSTPHRQMGYMRIQGHMMKYISRAQMEEQIKYQPIVMGIGVSNEFHHYGGGVDMGDHCDPNRGHSMLIVGHGREDGVEYWLMRNSYSIHWGMKGFYKIAKDATKCYLDGYQGAIVDSHGKNVFVENYNNQYNGNAVKYRLNHYVPGAPQRYFTNTDVATPPSY